MSDVTSESSDQLISTVALETIVENLRHHKHRGSTKANYYTVWRQFNQFFVKLDKKPKTWENRVTLFVGYLINDNKKSSTIKCYVSAIKAVLQYVKVDLKLDVALLSSLTKACQLTNDTVRTRLPIRYDLLVMLI